MSERRRFDIAVLGGGPTGLAAALAAAKRGRVVLVLEKLPAQHGLARIDTIPARTLALLTELGVKPQSLGVDRLMNGRWSSWESEEIVWRHGAPTVHIERPWLEFELFKIVSESGIAIIVDRARPVWKKGFAGHGWRAEHLIDASGRTAVTARERLRPRYPWASRFYWTRRPAHVTADFHIAALPEGYAYRLGSAEHLGIGFAGRGALLKAQQTSLEAILKQNGAGWLLEDLPPIASLSRGASGISSVQWADAEHAALAGDAAIARDALSSQGLAMSISDALYAVAALGHREPLERRYEAGLSNHLAALDQLLAACRYRERPVFRAYRSFVQKHSRLTASPAQPALRDGRLIEDLPQAL